MGKYLNMGNDGFTSVTKGIYVDKTEMIEFTNSILGTKEKMTCVSRPRRFGKSFAAQMLCAYYDKSCDSRKLFENYKIAKHESFEKYLNKYDVIYLDITWFISCAKDIKNILRDLEKEVTKELSAAYPQVSVNDSLPQMMAEISETTGNKFIVIIDEWDAIFKEAKNDFDLQKEYIQLLRSMFKSSLTDKMIEMAYITGILPIKKYGTQSAMTDFREYTMVSPGRLAEYVGFTEQEVKQLCDEYHIDFEETKRWYDGYSFNRIKSVYNPNSVMEAVKREEFGSYWTRTETYESLKIYIDLNEDGLKEAIVQMIGGTHIPIDVGTFQNDLTSINSKDDVMTLLVHLGYLAYNASEKSVFIPNQEIREEFVRAVAAGKHKEIAKLIKNSDLLLEQTLCMEEEAVAKAIEKAHDVGTSPRKSQMRSISSNGFSEMPLERSGGGDTYLSYNNEQALKSVIRFAYISCVDEFVKIEELPSGKGYADVVFLPKKSSSMPMMLIELKWNRTENSAISQIKNRNYPAVLKEYGGEILLVGINYDADSKKHSCKIERYNE